MIVIDFCYSYRFQLIFFDFQVCLIVYYFFHLGYKFHFLVFLLNSKFLMIDLENQKILKWKPKYNGLKKILKSAFKWEKILLNKI